MKVDLRENGLFGCTTYNANVDRKYIESKERLEVLQGLLDTDGWVEACGSAAFCSASKQLVTDVVEIARSLGLMAREPKYKANECAGAWLTHITWDGITKLFKIKRKQDKLIKAEERYRKRWIESIEFLELSDGVCFEVEGNLFLTKDYHVTHNSALVSWLIFGVYQRWLIQRWSLQLTQRTSLRQKLGLNLQSGIVYLLTLIGLSILQQRYFQRIKNMKRHGVLI